MSPRTLFRAALLCSVALPLFGCTLQAEPKVEKRMTDAATKLATEKPDPVAAPAVAFTSGAYYGSRVIRAHHGVPLPPGLAAKRLTITDGRAKSLSEFAALLSEAAGVPVRVEGGGFVSGPAMSGADPTAEKLLARANGAPGLPTPALPARVMTATAVPMSTAKGVVRMKTEAIFISNASIFFPRYSGVLPIINPAMNTPRMANIRME